MAVEPDNKLGQYTLIEKIAQGGMAEVYKAKTKDAQGVERFVVIKRILPHIATHPEYVEMLIDEAKIAVHFTHGNIAQIYDLGSINDDYFIVMEYVDGRTFSQIYRALNEREQRIPVDILLYCIIELCQGLSYIHRKKGPNGVPLGVVHRDISPQNIILNYAGMVKIIDFGVARADFIAEKTDDGVLKGKFAYMSPEQTKASAIDHRSDIFSTGILLWELACGQRLFKRANHKDTIKAIQKTKFDLPSKIRHDLPKELDEIVRRALAKSPRSRYQDAIEMAEDLEKILFKINPKFRPIHAAKFLYKLFGPEQDEKEFSHPDLTTSESPVQEHHTPEENQDDKTPIDLVKADADEKKDWEEPTLKDKLRKNKTPMFNWRWAQSVSTMNKYFFVALFIFILGSSYTFYNHIWSNKSYLLLTGKQDGMQIKLDGQILPDTFEDKVPVLPNTPHTLEITQKGHLSKTLSVQLQKQEQLTVDLQLEKIPETSDLSVFTTPQGADVFINGQLQPQKTPATFKGLKATDKILLSFKLKHYKPVTKEVELKAGSEVKIFQPLEFQYMELLVSSVPTNALVFIDGKEMGTTPYYSKSILPGQNHVVTVVADGHLPATQTLESTSTSTDTNELHFVLQAR